MLLDPENIGKAFEISLLSCIQSECTLSTSGYRPPPLIFHSPWRRTVLTFVPPWFSGQRNKRIPLKFHIYSTCNYRYKNFRIHARHFNFRLNADRILHRAMLLPAAVTSASSKTNAAMSHWLPLVIYTLWFICHKVYLIFTKKSSTPRSLPVTSFDNGLDYMSKISITSFHPALMALGIHRRALENVNGPLRYL